MKDVYIFGIESSCDETSCSIVKNGKEEIATIISSQIDVHKNFGGVVPEIASRHHVKNITMVIEECLWKAQMTIDDMDAIAVTYGPGLIGSLLVGLEAAKTLAWIHKKPLIPVHHISGHIYANNLVEEMKFPLIALIISGGHTELVYMKNHYSFEKLGGTLDDAVGECYDKVARVIEVPYPGGPTLDRWSTEGNDTYDLPIPLNDNSYNFSFSGLKSAFINTVHHADQVKETLDKADLAASFQQSVVDVLAQKTVRALENYPVKQLILAGGVAANQGLRDRLDEELKQFEDVELLKAPLKLCGDNAAMIGAAGYAAYKDKIFAGLDLNADPSLEFDWLEEA